MNEKDIPAFLEKKASRRSALKGLGLGALGIGALGLRSATAASSEATSAYPKLVLPQSDIGILDFALNLEYLEAQYYSYALTGAGIDSQGVALTGRGTQGDVTFTSTGPVQFTSTYGKQYAAEIGADEIAHVNFIRGIFEADGFRPVAQPALDFTAAFNGIAAAAFGSGSTFDPFASETNFLLGAAVFEDVGVTAYHGAAPYIVNKSVLRAAAGILGTESFHASNLRTQIFEAGTSVQSTFATIGVAINTLGGDGNEQPVTVNDMSNIVPADADGQVFYRTTRQVKNIVYLGVNAKKGGFFPNGMNA